MSTSVPVLVILLSALVAITTTEQSEGQSVFPVFTDASSGSVDGVGFTITGLSGATQSNLFMGGADWNSAGSKPGVQYSANNASFTVTFDEPVANLSFYSYYLRGTSGGYDSYDFGHPFVVEHGFSGLTITGTTMDVSTTGFASGILRFTSPVTSFTVTGSGGAPEESMQGFTFTTPEKQVRATFNMAGLSGTTYRPADGDGRVPDALSGTYNDGAGTFVQVASADADFSYDSLAVSYDVTLTSNYVDSVNSARLVFLYDNSALELNDGVGTLAVKGIEPGLFFTAETDGNSSLGPIYNTRMLDDVTIDGVVHSRVEVTASTIEGNAQLYNADTVVLRYPLNNSSDGSSGFGYQGSPAISGATITSGSGLSVFDVSTDSWSGSVELLNTSPNGNIDNASAADAIANNWYFDITLTPASSMDLDAITLDWSRGGSSGTRGWFVRSSLDGYASDLYSNETPDGTPTGLNHASFDLTGFTNLTTATTFRFYIYTPSTVRYMDFQDITFEGEPNSSLMRLSFKLKKAGSSLLKTDLNDYDLFKTLPNGDLSGSLTLAAANSGTVEFYPGDTNSSATAGVPDGKVDFADLTGFASAYFTTTADAAYRLKYDIGSSSVTNYFTLPVSDGEVSFRDLVSFATGYTLSSTRNQPTSAPDTEGMDPLTLWLGEAKETSVGLFEVPVFMSGMTDAVSAMNLRVDGVFGTDAMGTVGAADAVAVQLEELFAGENGFVAHRMTDGVLEVDAARIGGSGSAMLQTAGAAYTILVKSDLTGGDERPLLSIRSAELVGHEGEALPFVIGESGDGLPGDGHSTEELPAEFALGQNYPNPFNPSTTITYALPEPADVHLAVYNITGQHIATLVSGTKETGFHEVNFDASNLSSGVYLYRLTAGDVTRVRQMMLVK